MSVFDVNWDKNRDVIRYHGLRKTNIIDGVVEKNTPYEGMRLFCKQWDDGDITYEEWNPYTLNRVEYSLGETIDFSTKGGNADAICEQIIKEDDYITVGEELNVCFDIKDKLPEKAMKLNMGVDSILGSEQRMFVYANGHRVDTHVFKGGEDYTFEIPTEMVDKDGLLIFRFVFPGANSPHQLDVTSDDWREKSVNIKSLKLE